MTKKMNKLTFFNLSFKLAIFTAVIMDVSIGTIPLAQLIRVEKYVFKVRLLHYV